MGFSRQRGAALIMAVVTVAIITFITVAMSVEQKLLVRRVENIQVVDISWNYGLGGEQFAAMVLKQDRDDNEFDGAKDLWHTPGSYPIDQVILDGQLGDLQGRFNLSNLLQDDGSVDSLTQEALNRLLQKLGLSSELSAVMIDWVDQDQQESASGAEDTYYQTQENPYLTANQAFVSETELRLLKGVDDKAYDMLQDYVVVLPGRTALNVNLASPIVLQAYFPHMDQSLAQKIADKAAGTPYESAEEFKQDSDHGNNVKWDQSPEFGVQTEYFSLEALVTLGRIKTPLYSVLKRNSDGSVNVIYRVRGKY